MAASQLLCALMQLSFLGAGETSYASAYHQATETGKPMLVLIGADWCPHCVTMKNSVMPQVEQAGLLQQVSYVSLNSDRHPQLAGQMMRGRSVPQLLVYYRTGSGWRMRHITGSTSSGNVNSIIRQALDAVAADPPAGSSTVPVSDTKPISTSAN